MPPITDIYGNILKAGILVAFNYSGEVRLGKLLSIKTATKYGKTHDYSGEPYIKLEVQHQGSANTSTITRRQNLVVLPAPTT